MKKIGPALWIDVKLAWSLGWTSKSPVSSNSVVDGRTFC